MLPNQVLARAYVDKSGKKRCVGTKALKGSQQASQQNKLATLLGFNCCVFGNVAHFRMYHMSQSLLDSSPMSMTATLRAYPLEFGRALADAAIASRLDTQVHVGFSF